ncbi:hypothetical protein Pyrde_0915 [Pyrodictium delaneyi]|uniref:Uncharacterized protein n=1 Tax=Pyrodictium delaneyi TaxID=1273541 RepID=A0A0P0N3K4_9CREN|nr:hypothetical protein [Pyrodictium delaneyi]ALL00963.1 hypothetical protein Pyrde_0915 [Pyrodictium delaneyi]
METRNRLASREVLPPRPDIGAIAVAGAVIVLAVATGTPVGVALVTGIVVGVIALPILFLVREMALFHSKRPLRPEEAGVVAEWFSRASSIVGAREVTVLYTYRRGAGLQVMQLGLAGNSRSNEALQGNLVALIHRAAWNALPAALSAGSRVYIAVPARIMEYLYRLSGRSRTTVYLHLHSREQVRMVYRILREIAQAVNRGAGRLYVAYMATKAFTRLLVAGAIRLDPGVAENIDSLVPAEPPWIRRSIARQLYEEALQSIEP